MLTTTNGTRLLHMALDRGAKQIITGSLPTWRPFAIICWQQNLPVVLACAAWKDRVNIEDMLFAGAVVNRIKDHFDINCDSSQVADTMYEQAEKRSVWIYESKNASHFIRLKQLWA